MRRRQFITALTGAALVSGAESLFTDFSRAQAQAATTIPRTLVNVMLIGGADFRHVMVPAPDYDPAYVNAFWTARRGLYAQNFPDYATMYAAEYRSVTDPLSGRSFGIHQSCGWLVNRFMAGDVAVISNVLGSDNRRHDHSQLIVDAGDPYANQAQTLRDGWGGRLVEATGASSRVVVVSSGLSLFCMGTNPDDRLVRVIHAKDMRDMALPAVNPALAVTSAPNNMTRALRAYYQGRGIEIETEKAPNWPYRRFFQHFRSLDNFGRTIDDRLSGTPLSPALAALTLHNAGFAQQCRNLHDCCLASDILGSRVISMNYDGWDTHGGQQSKLSNFLPDVFGADGGIDTVSKQLAADAPGANDKLTYIFATDFGRQLATNGGLGTDHGRGNYFVIVGNDVRGGVYGEMFPAREARPDAADSQGRTPFQIPGTDIKGLTTFERVLAKTCDWVAPGSGSQVFPNAASGLIEPGVDLSGLFTA